MAVFTKSKPPGKEYASRFQYTVLSEIVQRVMSRTLGRSLSQIIMGVSEQEMSYPNMIATVTEDGTKWQLRLSFNDLEWLCYYLIGVEHAILPFNPANRRDFRAYEPSEMWRTVVTAVVMKPPHDYFPDSLNRGSHVEYSSIQAKDLTPKHIGDIADKFGIKP